VFDPQKRQTTSPSSVAQLVARSAVMTAMSKQPEGFWFDPRLRSMKCFSFAGLGAERLLFSELLRA
jgi:hypothetical protein